jgi:hypothetical protein
VGFRRSSVDFRGFASIFVDFCGFCVDGFSGVCLVNLGPQLMKHFGGVLYMILVVILMSFWGYLMGSDNWV